MATQLNRKLAITFLFSLAVLLALTAPSSANFVSPDSAHRRDHVNLNRMIKIRAVAPGVARQLGKDPVVINAADKPADSASSASPSATPSPSDAQQPSSAPNSPQSSSQPASSAPGTENLSVSSTVKPSSASSTSSAPSTSPTTSSARTTSTPSSSSTPTAPTSESKPLVTNGKPTVDSVTVTSHVPAASASSASDSQLGASSLSHTTITIIIVLASSIGGFAIIWTIIRKWKFRPSAQFEDRLEPVNWQPAEHESGLPTHRRMPSNASSFHSAGHDNLGLYRSDSTANRNLTPLPDHDFTAGASALAPVGGYADLARGPSPQPQMQETLQRGPSVNRGYENYLGPPPPHHQGGYGAQDAYDYNNAGPRY